MWNALKHLLSSKKAILGIVTAVTAGVAKIGWQIPSETVGLIVAPMIAAILGQGMADSGKEAAKIAAGSK